MRFLPVMLTAWAANVLLSLGAAAWAESPKRILTRAGSAMTAPAELSFFPLKDSQAASPPAVGGLPPEIPAAAPDAVIRHRSFDPLILPSETLAVSLFARPPPVPVSIAA
jgi:hypothetical protein